MESQHTKQQSTLITSLREQVSSSPAGAPEPSNEGISPDVLISSSSDSLARDDRLEQTLQMNRNLERELRLMASAWHDQNVRLLSSATSSRSQPAREHKSFLGKQRRIVQDALVGKSTG